MRRKGGICTLCISFFDVQLCFLFILQMSSFKFLPEDTPQQQLFTDVQNMNSFSDEQLKEFMSIVISFLSLKEDSQTMMDRFSQTHRVNPKTLGSMMQNSLFFFSECLKLSLKPEDVHKDLIALGLSEDNAVVVAKIYKKAFATLSGSLIDNTFKVNKLVDIEWKFGVTAATSELSDVGTCFLQLKLALDKDGKKENVVFEMTLSQFYAFFTAMQKAAAEIQSA